MNAVESEGPVALCPVCRFSPLLRGGAAAGTRQTGTTTADAASTCWCCQSGRCARVFYVPEGGAPSQSRAPRVASLLLRGRGTPSQSCAKSAASLLLPGGLSCSRRCRFASCTTSAGASTPRWCGEEFYLPARDGRGTEACAPEALRFGGMNDVSLILPDGVVLITVQNMTQSC